ncbi:hypothetical protein C5167_018854 [Papaver somniferum]|uniref:Gag1-like clamp domain-containing protein n=1 Tax=Papaver somniferum TaxID=3469 RepID=A0A4Y7IQM6_PAPSO|nr:hypothetical protein C5167_018854 [Papaver somniferum]
MESHSVCIHCQRLKLLQYDSEVDGKYKISVLVLIISLVKPDLLQNRGCLGCCSLPTHLLSTDEKGQRGQRQPVRKPSILEDFWSTTSTCEMDNGFLLWKQVREQWLGNKKSDKPSAKGREPVLSWNATYEGLLGTNKPFARPVPLSEMVDFLVDVWEQEGLYD